MLDRFRREVKLARRVTHPNVARTYDIGQHEKVRFITMELVSGESLADVLSREKRLGLAETLRVAEQIARGLSAAHAAGVVHRDLKPANIMRGPGPAGRVVITDFGIARSADGGRGGEDPRLTGKGIIGTPAYMAPEQLVDEPIDGRTDIYAFGMVLYELLSGAAPFQDKDVMASIAARLAGEVPDLRALAPNVPEPLARLIHRTFARRREARPDAETMLQEIERMRGSGERIREVGALKAALASRARLASSPEVLEICDRAYQTLAARTLPNVHQTVVLLEGMLAKHPDEPMLLCMLGAALTHLFATTGARDTEAAARAEELLLRALAAEPSLARAHHSIGFLRAEQGELRAAVRAFEEAIARDPLFSDSHAALGAIMAETGHTDLAFHCFDAAIKLDPDAHWTYVERARTRALVGDREAAEQDIVRAGTARFSLLVRTVVWWNDRARAAELADRFEKSPTGAVWEIAAPFLRAFAAGEPLAGAFDRLRAALSFMHPGSRNACRLVEAATEILASWGEIDHALELLENAESLPFVNVLWLDRCSPLEPLREHPRFARVRGLVAARAADLWR